MLVVAVWANVVKMENVRSLVRCVSEQYWIIIAFDVSFSLRAMHAR